MTNNSTTKHKEISLEKLQFVTTCKLKNGQSLDFRLSPTFSLWVSKLDNTHVGFT